MAAGAEAVLQAQRRGGFRGPEAGAVGTIAAEPEPDGGDLGFGHRGVDEPQPVGPARDRPRIEGRSRVSGPEARPGPILGPLDQPGAQGIPLEVADDGLEMLVLPDRERLEPPCQTCPLCP